MEARISDHCHLALNVLLNSKEDFNKKKNCKITNSKTAGLLLGR